ncbi:MAG TPA: polymer-forming cytoskeletal protein [Candidatus Dormibacteraeota bacterium]
MARGDRGRQDDNGFDGGANHVRLGPKDSLVGKLTIAGDLHVQGSVEGELSASGDIQVDAPANIKATLEGRNVTIEGQVQGNVNARRRLTLSGSGALNGDVRVSRLSVEDGATLNGNVSMQAAPPEESENNEGPSEAEAVVVAEGEHQG